MLRIALGAFVVLHGFVHLWYVGLSNGWVTVEDQMGWTGHSRLLSGRYSRRTILAVASSAYLAVGIGFATGGVGYVLEYPWAGPLVVGSAMVSTVAILAMWGGGREKPVEKGAVGVLINACLLVVFLLG